MAWVFFLIHAHLDVPRSRDLVKYNSIPIPWGEYDPVLKRSTVARAYIRSSIVSQHGRPRPDRPRSQAATNRWRQVSSCREGFYHKVCLVLASPRLIIYNSINDTVACKLTPTRTETVSSVNTTMHTFSHRDCHLPNVLASLHLSSAWRIACRSCWP